MSDITKKTRVLTYDDLVSMMENVMKKNSEPDIDALRKKQEKAILKRELGQEKLEKITALAKKGSSASKLIQALGSDTFTPLQLATSYSCLSIY